MILVGIVLLFFGALLQVIARYQAVKGSYYRSLWKPWKGLLSPLSLAGFFCLLLALIVIYFGYKQI